MVGVKNLLGDDSKDCFLPLVNLPLPLKSKSFLTSLAVRLSPYMVSGLLPNIPSTSVTLTLPRNVRSPFSFSFTRLSSLDFRNGGLTFNLFVGSCIGVIGLIGGGCISFILNGLGGDIGDTPGDLVENGLRDGLNIDLGLGKLYDIGDGANADFILVGLREMELFVCIGDLDMICLGDGFDFKELDFADIEMGDDIPLLPDMVLTEPEILAE